MSQFSTDKVPVFSAFVVRWRQDLSWGALIFREDLQQWVLLSSPTLTVLIFSLGSYLPHCMFASTLILRSDWTEHSCTDISTEIQSNPVLEKVCCSGEGNKMIYCIRFYKLILILHWRAWRNLFFPKWENNFWKKLFISQKKKRTS